jgi:ribonuclease HI
MKVEIFSDGACSGNPGPGGYGVILRAKGREKELSGGERDTTNNRMELTGVIEGLKALKYPCDVVVTTDSKYVCDGITKGWAKKWQDNGYKRKTKDVPNADLWEKLLTLCSMHNVTFSWVRGHNGHPENERCDELARKNIKSVWKGGLGE